MIPVIDLFAGPGGLGEGFSSFSDAPGSAAFGIVLSIEKDRFAHQTLQLRSFTRQFPKGKLPEEYYKYLRGKIDLSTLLSKYPDAARAASTETWQAELGKTPAEKVDERITRALGGAKEWVLIGGPPCQAYSIVGRVRMKGGEKPHRYEQDKRHFLYKEYLRILEKHSPTAFVMENVKGMLSASVKGELIIEQILKDLKALRYRLFSFVDGTPSNGALGGAEDPVRFVIRAEDYGIPQARHRVILLGLREDILTRPAPLAKAKSSVKMSKVIADLPPIRSILSRGKDSGERWVKEIAELCTSGAMKNGEIDARVKSKILWVVRRLRRDLRTGAEFLRWSKKPAFRPDWFWDPALKGVCNHAGRAHIASDLRRYFFAACFARIHGRSPILADFPKSLLPDHKNVSAGVSRRHFADRFRVQVKNRPATTVTCHIAKDGHYFIHPNPRQCRSLTVREAARLQTFPDNYFFLGPRTAQYQQVGNAVPPLLARSLAGVLHSLLSPPPATQTKSSESHGSPDKGKAKLEYGAHSVPAH